MSTKPHTFDELLDAIDNKVTMIHATWKIYRQMYGTSQARLDLLNAWVPDFIGIIQRVLWDSVILSICRLCDPPVQRGNKNLTLTRLVDSLTPAPDAALAASLDVQLKSLEGLANALLRHRHKRLAHTDLANAMSATDILPGVSRKMIEEILKAVRELLNSIHLAYRKDTFGYELVELRGDGDTLIRCVQSAQQLSDIRDELSRGSLSTDELAAKVRSRSLPEF